jgi:hypothetical protein
MTMHIRSFTSLFIVTNMEAFGQISESPILMLLVPEVPMDTDTMSIFL